MLGQTNIEKIDSFQIIFPETNIEGICTLNETTNNYITIQAMFSPINTNLNNTNPAFIILAKYRPNTVVSSKYTVYTIGSSDGSTYYTYAGYIHINPNGNMTQHITGSMNIGYSVFTYFIYKIS